MLYILLCLSHFYLPRTRSSSRRLSRCCRTAKQRSTSSACRSERPCRPQSSPRTTSVLTTLLFSLISRSIYLLQLPVTLLAHKHCIFHDRDNVGSMIFFRTSHTLSITAVRLSKLRGRIDVPASL